MPNALLKVRLWSKLLAFLVAGAYLLLVLIFNADGSEVVEVWWFFGQRLVGSPLTLMLVAAAAGAAVALTGRMLLLSGRQLREVRRGGGAREARQLRREIDAMKRQAAGGEH